LRPPFFYAVAKLMTNVVIIGAGQAACQTAVSLRQGGFNGAINLYGDELYLPYERPPLSKAVLTGDQEPERTLLRSEAYYLENKIGMHLGQTITVQNLPSYDILVLATGMSPRTLSGFPASKTHVLRTINDAERLRLSVARDTRVLILGAGFIGLEAAAALAGKVNEIKVYDLASQVMGRAAAEPIASSAQIALEAKGITFCLQKSVSAEEADSYDLILIAVGGEANDQLAVELGLCEPGKLKADRNSLVADNIYAVGDVAIAQHNFLPQPARLESVDQAIYSAKCAAAHILGNELPPAAAPWFWSFQGDWKLQMVGIWCSDLRPVFYGGQPGDQSFSVFGFRNDKLIAAQCVNRPADFAASRRLVGIDYPNFDQRIQEEGFKLKMLL